MDVEYFYNEQSFFLAQPDGKPFPEDGIEDPAYTGSCSVLTREILIFESDKLQKTDNKTSLIMNGVNPSSFPRPDTFNGSQTIVCDVFLEEIKVEYNAEASSDETSDYSTFGDVLDVFDFADAFFQLPLDFALPFGDKFFVTQFLATHGTLNGIPIDCSFKLESAVAIDAWEGREPRSGDVTCKIHVSDIKEAGADVQETIEALRTVFISFHESSIWAG